MYFKGGYDQKRTGSTADINQLLQHVETKFSDVLIPASQIVTQEYLGQGMYIKRYILQLLQCIYLGAFGVVHKGELKDLDGAMSPVAIKTIKCKKH